MYKNIIPDGTRDLTNEECIKRDKVINLINNTFDLWGYKEVITPSIEFYDGFLVSVIIPSFFNISSCSSITLSNHFNIFE